MNLTPFTWKMVDVEDRKNKRCSEYYVGSRFSDQSSNFYHLLIVIRPHICLERGDSSVVFALHGTWD